MLLLIGILFVYVVGASITLAVIDLWNERCSDIDDCIPEDPKFFIVFLWPVAWPVISIVLLSMWLVKWLSSYIFNKFSKGAKD